MAGLPEKGTEAAVAGGEISPLKRPESPIADRTAESLMKQQLGYEARMAKREEDRQIARWQSGEWD